VFYDTAGRMAHVFPRRSCFPEHHRGFIPFGNTHYNTISMSVNTKTQDIVLLHKKTDAK
jgi:hypothetical protein